MLLKDNSKKVIEMLNWFDELNDLEKIRLSINVLESSYTNIDVNKNEVTDLLKKVLNILDEASITTIVNFSKYKKLTFITSKYIELTALEKTNFIIEMLFNIYQNNFNNQGINDMINKDLDVYGMYYTIAN